MVLREMRYALTSRIYKNGAQQSASGAVSQAVNGCAAHSWPLQLHLLGARGGHGQGRAQKPSARLCQIEVWQRRAPGWQWSSSPSRPDSACRYDDGHSEKPTKSASAGPVCILDEP
jgi:hypothetical protein